MTRTHLPVEVHVPHRPTRRLLAAASLVVAVVAIGFVAAPQAEAAPRWANQAVATVHPGVQVVSPVGQCTANFVFFRGAEVYLGQAAHCTGTGAETDTNGCLTDSLPVGTKIAIEGATRPGVMVYNSWLAMQKAGEQDPETCAYNDFALVKVDPADVARVNPSLPHWGGPTGVNGSGIPPLGLVLSVGNSSLRGGLALLMPKSGISLGTAADGWVHPAYTITPGIPGDSGSAMLDAAGRATGILSTIQLTPLPASNEFVDVAHVMHYAQSHGMPGLLLAKGTRIFNPAQLPLML
jgi:hypothetical protein